jgi:hypothetical protein
MGTVSIPIIIFVIILALVVIGLKQFNKTVNSLEIIIGGTYVFSLFLFAIAIITHSNPYYKSIDPLSMECYSPFSDEHILTLIFYFLAFNISMLSVWTENKTLPPLTLTFSLIFILIGIILNAAIVFQVSKHDTESLGTYYSGEDKIMFLSAPILGILISIRLIRQIINQEISERSERKYSNKYLNYLNSFLATKYNKPIWLVILLFPVFFIVTLILILFGQDANSIIKVFTDTTTWRLSQQAHPPILNHTGHYLCTVAAAGDPKIVKPLRIGRRNGQQIIVNRQLLIANAFEEMVQDFSPKLHSVIRKAYDKYGYNISKKINTIRLSNITYILMKPLEWFFLICLYLFCVKPEEKINRQYTEKSY